MISIIHPYYNNIQTFYYQHSQWSQFSEYAKENIEIVVVDDGSPAYPCKAPQHSNGVDIKILRIEEDIPWNTAGAANLGITEAKYDWIFHIDMDKGVSAYNADRFLWLDFSDPLVQYWPQLLRTSVNTRGVVTDKFMTPHYNSYLMNKKTFWKTGGYDEDFGGNYGYQDSLFHYDCKPLGLKTVRLMDQKKEPYLNFLDTSYACPDSRCLVDRGSGNGKLYKDKVHGLVERNYKILNFNWHQVYP